MNLILLSLALSAIAISFVHTASGPDHYLPLIVFSRTRKWNMIQTISWTTLCGLGHVLSSVVIGLLGVLLGWELSQQNWLQDLRGNLSGWCLLAFGLIYLFWGLYKAFFGNPHKHFTVDDHDNIYVYQHSHTHGLAHRHSQDGHAHHHDHRTKVTPWILFAIFVMGPSEPLIPLLFYSGTQRSASAVLVLIVAYTLSTTLTMLTAVLLGCYGYTFFKLQRFERFSQTICGAVVTTCGIGMVFLGW